MAKSLAKHRIATAWMPCRTVSPRFQRRRSAKRSAEISIVEEVEAETGVGIARIYPAGVAILVMESPARTRPACTTWAFTPRR